MQKNKRNVRFLAQAAAIAALYAALTYAANAVNLAYGFIQFRFSEALMILPIFTPAAIPGLTLGCFISNIGSPYGFIDWIFGTSATFLSVICVRAVSEIRFKNLPILSPLMPVIFNAVIIGFTITCFGDTSSFALSNFSFAIFISMALSVGIGEFVVCYLLGIPLFIALDRVDRRYPELFRKI